MKKVILALLLAPSIALSAGIGFINNTTMLDGTNLIRSGTLYGLATGPTGGTYEVVITNDKSFKGNEFKSMNCTVHKQLAVPMVKNFKDKITMQTTFYEADGTLNTVTGYMAGTGSLPENGYTVNVNNRAKNDVWNLLKCTIK